MIDILQNFIMMEDLDPNIALLLMFAAICIEVVIKIIAVFAIKSLIIKATKRVIAKSVSSERKAKTLDAILISIITYAMYVILCLQIIPYFGVESQSILAITGIGTVALGFASQSLVKDFITGGFILMEDQFGVGDLVTIGGLTGNVENIGMRTTSIRSLNGDLHIFPNGEIKIVTNMSNEFKRAIVEVPVNYDADIDSVLEILRDEMSKINISDTGKVSLEKQERAFVSSIQGLKQEPMVVGVVEFDRNYVLIRIMADCAVGESFAIERELRRLVKVRLEKEKIPLPRPNVSIITEEHNIPSL